MMLTFFFFRKYYKEEDGLHLDVGAYMKALEVKIFSLFKQIQLRRLTFSFYIFKTNSLIIPWGWGIFVMFELT